jgi:hypothetical protein
MGTDETVSRLSARYPAPDMTPEEFEVFVTTLFDSASIHIPGLAVQLHEIIQGTDGSFDFDATVRYQLAGLEFLVLVEAKLHKNPIKRGLVQELHSKLLSVGAHKAVMISTAPYQSGAMKFALIHGIALVTVTEGRFMYEQRHALPPSSLSPRSAPPPTREEAAEWGTPTFVGHCYTPGANGGLATTLMSTECPEYVAELLLGVPPASDG